MNAAQTLAQYGYTVAQAREWILSHTHNPQEIYSTTKSIGLTDSMLAEILKPVMPAVTAAEVNAYFAGNGIQTAYSILQNVGISVNDAAQWLAQKYYDAPTELVQTATSAGLNSSMIYELLSTKLPHINYQSVQAFVNNYGSLPTPTPTPPSVPSTPSTPEVNWDDLLGGSFGLGSLGDFSGLLSGLVGGNFSNINSMIRDTLKSLDYNEIMALAQFAETNENALVNGDQTLINTFLNMINQAVSTPTDSPFLSDNEINNVIQDTTNLIDQAFTENGIGDIWNNLGGFYW